MYCSVSCRNLVIKLKKREIVAIPCIDCGNTSKGKRKGRCQPCYSRNRIRTIKQQVIDAYGGQCSCCGERYSEFLTVDHKYNDGSKHRKEHFEKSGSILLGGTLYLKIIRDGFPEMFQILCWNCNLAKSLFGGCPHLKKSSL